MEMRDCGDFAESISAYLDDELSAVELLALAGHLKACPACSRLMDRMLEVKNVLHRAEPFWPKPVPSGNFIPALKRELERETGRGFRIQGKTLFGAPRRVASMAGAALLAALLLVGTVAYFNFQRRAMVASTGQSGGGKPPSSYLLARGSSGDNLDEYIREHAMESSPNLLLEDENMVEMVAYELP